MQWVSDPIDLFMQWYNMDRAYMSLDTENKETPVQTFARKMPKPSERIIDE